jgi:hypothetical protein
MKLSKGKPRHNPNKPQNKYGDWCSYCDEVNGKLYCEQGKDANICKGNPHNCIKVLYKIAASRSDTQKIDNVRINK